MRRVWVLASYSHSGAPDMPEYVLHSCCRAYTHDTTYGGCCRCTYMPLSAQHQPQHVLVVFTVRSAIIGRRGVLTWTNTSTLRSKVTFAQKAANISRSELAGYPATFKRKATYGTSVQPHLQPLPLLWPDSQ